MIALLYYLIICTLVGGFVSLDMASFASYLNGIPIGDLEFHDTKYKYPVISYICFPCFIVIWIYLLIVRIINSVLERL